MSPQNRVETPLEVHLSKARERHPRTKLDTSAKFVVCLERLNSVNHKAGRADGQAANSLRHAVVVAHRIPARSSSNGILSWCSKEPEPVAQGLNANRSIGRSSRSSCDSKS